MKNSNVSGCSNQSKFAGRAAIYARYSTKFQDSVEDQVRECRQWAEENGYAVCEDLIFTDRGKSGRMRRRSGRQALQEAIEADQFDVLVVFATSRLDRNKYRIEQFCQEEIVERGLRAVFVMSGVDTSDESWDLNLTVRGIVDSQQAKSNVAHIRAAHIGLFNDLKVTGSMTFGYQGVEVEGRETRQGRPRRRYAIDPEAAEWVKRVFEWHVRDRMSRATIVRRLNKEGAPLSPRCTTGRWTSLAVKTLLANPRYRGEWSYGRKEAVLLNGKDYVRQIPREQPLVTQQVEELRIVDDATWYEAQALTDSNPHSRGREPEDRDRKSRPKMLNGLLRCAYHGRRLVVGGSNGKYYLCPTCQDLKERPLYTMLKRRPAMEKICESISDLLCRNEALVTRVIMACQQAAEVQQQQPAEDTTRIQRDIDRLSRQIDVIFNMPGEADEDVRENQAKVASLRSQRREFRARLAKADAHRQEPIEVPTEADVRAILDEFAKVLEAASGSDDEVLEAQARRIIELVTGGRILVRQCGERRPNQGWHKMTFDADLMQLAAEDIGLSEVESNGQAVELELREQPIHEEIAEEAKRLWDEGLKYTEIAEKVGWNRNMVADAIGYWHESRGLPAPDGRKHMSRLKKEPRLAERIADEVMSLVEQDMPLGDIAQQLGTSRNRVTEAIKIWHEARDLPVPDGRAFRKQRNERRRKSKA